MHVDALVASSPLVGSLAGRYLVAQLRGDRQEAVRLVEHEALERGMAVPDIHRLRSGASVPMWSRSRRR
jgi:hypothetical protein